MKKLFVIFLTILWLASCANNEKSIEISDYTINKDTVTISENSPILNKLITQKIIAKPYTFELSTSGIVKVIPNNYALIAAPFAGRITKSYVRLGQIVKAGSPIFEICSPSYYESGKIYYQAKEEMFLADKNLSRQKDLLSHGVGIQKDMEEAEVNYSLRKRDYENALASLKVYQVDSDNLILGQPLIVRSPINGTVVENNIVIGQYIKEDSDPIATVAELSKVWIAGQVKEKDIRYIDYTTEVGIQLISFPEKTFKGRIYHISSVIDENARSEQVLIECDNYDRIMKPGMYATAKFIHKQNNSIVIKSSSVFQMDDASYVFVMIGENKYLKKKIEILTMDNEIAIVKSGLIEGDIIIENGGFYLLEEK